ncbi:MAG: type II toxin-antitoxin system VapC family toxin [Planctomycetota bacterium]
MFVLDSDHLIILQQHHEPYCKHLQTRLEGVVASDIFLTVVTIHEQMLGANNFIARAKDRNDVVRGYRMIDTAMIDYEQYNVLPFDEPAAIRFDELRKQGVRIGTMDLRIASIALSHGFIVLTRNSVDFEKVPGLRVEDWTIA